MTGHCHCGGVTLTLARRPDFVNDCDCSLCSNAGARWAYFDGAEVTIRGGTRGYRRADMGEPAAEVHFCPGCGGTTHFTATEHHPGSHVGVNMRLFDPADLAGIELRYPAGRAWDKVSPFGYRRPAETLGSDLAAAPAA